MSSGSACPLTEAGRRILELVYAGFYVARCKTNGEWVVTLGRSDREPVITCRGADIGVVADEALAALRYSPDQKAR